RIIKETAIIPKKRYSFLGKSNIRTKVAKIIKNTIDVMYSLFLPPLLFWGNISLKITAIGMIIAIVKRVSFGKLKMNINDIIIKIIMLIFKYSFVLTDILSLHYLSKHDPPDAQCIFNNSTD